MYRQIYVAVAALAGLAACTPPADSPTPGQPAGAAAAAVACQPAPQMAVAGRASPYDSAVVTLGGAQAKVCYGRPSARGRTVFGGGGAVVALDTLWRTGANEPTILHLPFRAQLAGLALEPGSYSIYTVPHANQWTVVVNRSTSQWGHERSYTPEIRAQEVGRLTVPAGRTAEFVETFTIRAQPRGANAADLLLEWENTQVRIPMTRGA